MEKATLSIIHRLHNIIQMTVHCFAYSQKHIRCNIVSLAQPFGLRLLWPLLTSHNSLLLQLMEPPVRFHGINFQFFLVYLLIYAGGLRSPLGLRCLKASTSANHASYQVSVRQNTISLSLLLAYISRCKPRESPWAVGSYAPCGISPQTDGMPVIPPKAASLPAAFGVMIYARFLPLSYVSSAICQALRPARVLRHRAWTVSFPAKC